MFSNREEIEKVLDGRRLTWLVSGCAGFIGSNLVEALLLAGQRVVGVDDFSTGHRKNLQEAVPPAANRDFRFFEGSILDRALSAEVCRGVDIILHEAALASVPRSIEEPMGAIDANVGGFFELLNQARLAGVRRFIYASSSAVYGERNGGAGERGVMLSPYAMTKFMNEVGADVFSRVYGIECVGLRYFNVFGPRQDPAGAYAAVIPVWIESMLAGKSTYIFGDGTTTRDYCHVGNIVTANIRAALTEGKEATNRVYDISSGESVSLRDLHQIIREAVAAVNPGVTVSPPEFRPFRAGDILHSRADIRAAADLLGFKMSISMKEGLAATVGWYRQKN